MPEPRVLMDTNVLISGLVFSGGNEHRILRLAEDGEITLVLPEFVLQETERVLLSIVRALARYNFSAHFRCARRIVLASFCLPNMGNCERPISKNGK